MCVFCPPEPPGAGKEGAGLGEGRTARRGREQGAGRARSDGRARKKNQLFQSPPLCSPPAPVSFFSWKLLGVNRVFFLLGKMDSASRGGGEKVGKEAAAATGFIFHPSFLLPPASAGSHGGQSSGPAARPSPVPGRVLRASLPAGLPVPRSIVA